MKRGSEIALIVVGIHLALVVVIGGLVAFVVMSLSGEPDVPNDSVLVLKVEGTLPDFTNSDELSSRFFGAPKRLTSSSPLAAWKRSVDWVAVNDCDRRGG